MMPPILRAAPAAALLVAAMAGNLGAQQNLFPEGSAIGGVEARQYNFDSKTGIDHVRQVAFPLAVVAPLGQRFSFDIGTWYATTSVAAPGGDASFSGLTDTQVRLAYSLGRDAVVASVMVNLPTGKETTTQRQFLTSTAASSNFLLFPVNTYGSGTSVTPGLAGAVTVGQWNLGLAASVRWSDKYQPFSDSASAGLRYQPGVETRFRFGADRLIGQSRLTLGFTFSTFANDELQGGGLGSTTFDPGERFLVDAMLASPVGRGTVSLYAWDYNRTSSGSVDRENVLAGGATGSFPLSGRTTIEPLVEARFWFPETGSGKLFGGGARLKIPITDEFAFIPGGRVDVGDLSGDSLFGWDLSGMIKYSFK
jgi:hypothetical protein